jgi:hypothetical protein
MDGMTGVGKTVFIYLLPLHDQSINGEILRVPDNIEFKEVLTYINNNISKST